MRVSTLGRWVIPAVVALAAFVAEPVRPAEEPRRLVAIVLENDDDATRARVVTTIRQGGGRVAHVLDGLVVAEVTSDAEENLRRSSGVRETSPSPLPRGRARGRGEGARLALEAWNLGVADPEARRGVLRRPRGEPPPLDGEHAWLPPGADLFAPDDVRPFLATERVGPGSLDATGAGSEPFAQGLPFGATDQNTSEYLAGRVSVNVVLVESDGSIDVQIENWNAERESQVLNGLIGALEWLRQRQPQAGLEFVYHVYAGRTDPRARTGYEPIRRRADPHGGAGEALWAGEILVKMGYGSGDRFARSRAWANATRVADGTDWAVNLFVVDSLTDTDGAFADGYFAYTWVGGPHLVLTYDNQAWGIARFDMVARHEILHAFYAFDEYASSRCACTDHRGYLDGANSNCSACNASASPCVMIANGDFFCAHTSRQVGWADLDGDGVIDVVGEDPDTFLDPAPALACGIVDLTGTATVVAPTNRNPVAATPQASISLAVISSVEARIDGGGPWTEASPEDGAWGAPVERFRVRLAPPVGTRIVEVRARDDFGNVDATGATARIEVADRASDIGATLAAGREGLAKVGLLWESAAGAVAYRVERASGPEGPYGIIGETDATSWSDETVGTAYYRIVAIDACGVAGD